ncbi:MAG TPA: excinuclease ABC subunit UvrC [Gammaproteobacteria bacterium]
MISHQQVEDSATGEFDIQNFLKNLTIRPGVYRMIGADGEVLYVGKARNLKRRVSSYFQRNDGSAKTLALVAQIRRIEVTITHTENEALILENTLIKEYQPRYNILLRDDKSYPYIYLSDEAYPRLSFHRGRKSGKGRYFGPYPSSAAVRESLNTMQKLFPVRQCEDAFFRNRGRPCLQFQIKRCTAPCVGLINEQNYQDDVRHAVMFLEGRSSAIIDELVAKMERAAEKLNFELAARYRDQIAQLRRVQERQYVVGEGGDLDVVAIASRNGTACVQLFLIRGGQNLGNKAFFPRHTREADNHEIAEAFIAQHYLAVAGGEQMIPAEILVSEELAGAETLGAVLSEQAGRRVTISSRLRGERARWVELARTNADQALAAHLASKATLLGRFEALQEALGLDNLPQRLECFDISHTMGEATVASCVVFDTNGPLKSDYRRFNIEGITPGDDYAAMQQALTRRFRRLKEGEGKAPDILFIDGGAGQLRQAERVLEEMQLAGVTLVGVAKGTTRKPGLEQLILSGQEHPLILPADSMALHLIQQIRDEAHRFAITGHRQRRAKARKTSSLEGIAGLGPKRRQQLLRQFGGLQEVARAGVEDLARVTGISRQLAQRIYDAFHTEER